MRALALVLAIASLVACEGGRKRLQCLRTVHGVDNQPGHVLWFGEMHGTEESPRFVGDVVCEAARWERVQLGLEISQDEQLRINHFLIDGDRTKLLAGPWWSQHDGRSSTGMLALLEEIRRVRDGGGRVEVVAYDVTNEADRDAAMARTVLASRDTNRIFIGLSGNIHSRKTKWNDLTPLVAHLVEAKLTVKTYDVVASGGTMWSCMATPDHEPTCGEHPNGPPPGVTPGKTWYLGPPRDDSHDGVYYVGDTKAAPPAKP